MLQIALPQDTVETWNVNIEDYKPEIHSPATYLFLEVRDKAALHDEILANGQLSLLDPVPDFRYQISLNTQLLVESHQEFKDKMQTVDFRFYFVGLTKWALGKTHECIFIKGNLAWIKPDAGGIYRYYSKDQDRCAVFGLNIFDLIEIREGVYSFTKARRTLAHDVGASYRERDWEYEQERKYRRNIILLHDIERLQAEAPSTFRFIGNYLQVLEHLNEWGLSHIWESIMSVQGESVFFNATTNMAQILNKDQSNCSRAVNMFAILGLIKKVPPSEAPPKLMNIASALRQRNKLYRPLNFYQIPLFDLLIAESRAKVMIANGITNMSLISQRRVEQVFGTTFAEMIYVNPTFAEQMDSHIERELENDELDEFMNEY